MEQSTEKLSNFIEDTDNPIIQVLQEFLSFLYLVKPIYSNDRTLHNILLQARKLHMRVLLDFFSNKRNPRYDDYRYNDFITAAEDLSVFCPNNLWEFINKSLMHPSDKRGKLSVPTSDLENVKNSLVESIERFIKALDSKLNSEFAEFYKDDRIKVMKKKILSDVCVVKFLNGPKGK